ncbi:MAG: formyltransferase family protein [Parvibaculales bacterium]
MKKKILFLGERRMADKALQLFFQEPYKEIFDLRGIMVDNVLEARYASQCSDSSVTVISNVSRNEHLLLELIKQEHIDCLISVQHPWILSPEIINAVSGMAFNLHNAKLPHYKGYNSLSHEILANEEQHTSTLHWISEVVDEGDLVFEESVEINENDTALSLYQKSLSSSFNVFKKFLDALAQNDIPRIKYRGKGRFFKRNTIDAVSCLSGLLDTETIARHARAAYFPPYNVAYFKDNNEKFAVLPYQEVAAYLNSLLPANQPQTRENKKEK